MSLLKKHKELVFYKVVATEVKGRGINLSGEVENSFILSNEKLIKGLIEVLKKTILVLDDELKRMKKNKNEGDKE